MTKTNFVIDTDIGTDPDDAFALAYAIKNNADIKAITITQGDTIIRAKIARKLERILGINIPITAGKSGSKDMIKKYWTGIEPLALTQQELNENLENNKFPEYDKDTKLICIGLLTNIAFQLENNPSIKNVKEVYIMGSEGTHNMITDNEAAQKVFSQPWKIFQITNEVSKKVCFTLNELEALKKTELGNFLYESTKRWADYTGRTEFPMYDALAVSAALGEDFVKFNKTAENRFISYDVDIKFKNKIMEAIKS
ncbi:MAG: nucleoside hydrolase [Candidatus Nanoarchaeia archaeon]|nr:nucleoside hydrolase [Candidatus Nanoarchaeia archaeon]MDD5740470.1 nucleoside hydrolase [Candidatus Nanoarchaeia archaeon]